MYRNDRKNFDKILRDARKVPDTEKKEENIRLLRAIHRHLHGQALSDDEEAKLLPLLRHFVGNNDNADAPGCVSLNDAQNIAFPEHWFVAYGSADRVNALLKQGRLEEALNLALCAEDSLLTVEGREMLTRFLRRRVLHDDAILRRLPLRVLDNFDRALPALMELRRQGDGWDIVPAISVALRDIAYSGGAGLALDASACGVIEPAMEFGGGASHALAALLATASVQETGARMAVMAAECRRCKHVHAQDTGSTPEQSFTKAFLRPLATVGDEFMIDFRPDRVPLHAAMLWAYEADDEHTVEAAIAVLEHIMQEQGADPEDVLTALDMFGELAHHQGAIAIYRY